MFVEDVDHSERDAIVVLQLYGVYGVECCFGLVFVEKPVAYGCDGILVPQFGVYAFPKPHAEVGTEADVAVAVGGLVGHHLRDGERIGEAGSMDESSQLVDVVRIADFGQVALAFVGPMELAVAEANVCRNAVKTFV